MKYTIDQNPRKAAALLMSIVDSRLELELVYLLDADAEQTTVKLTPEEDVISAGQSYVVLKRHSVYLQSPDVELFEATTDGKLPVEQLLTNLAHGKPCLDILPERWKNYHANRVLLQTRHTRHSAVITLTVDDMIVMMKCGGSVAWLTSKEHEDIQN